MERHLISMLAGQRGVDHCRLTFLDGLLDVVRDRAFAIEGSEAEREPVRCQRTWPVHEVEVQVGRVAVAAVAQESDDLTPRDVVPRPNPDGARLHVGVEGESPATNVDHDMIAQ